MEECLFCKELLPFSSHYTLGHNLEDCRLPLHSRTFSTRYEALHHLVETHGMHEDEVGLIGDKIDAWSLNINTASDCGLWRCGYCGLVGTDWGHRLQHIREHWTAGGPSFTNEHPWSVEKCSLDEVKSRPPGTTALAFYGFKVFKDAVRYRARLSAKERLEYV
jgi:hypothetical protein